jgi:glutamyl-tRNA synthetase
VAVTEYREAGFLPEALFNFLALLGWSPGGDREFLTRHELVRLFSFDAVGKKGAVFDEQKLEWLNGEYIKTLSPGALRDAIRPGLELAGLWDVSLERERKDWFEKVLEVLKPRARRLGDLVRESRAFLSDRIEVDPAAEAKHLNDPETVSRLAALKEALAGVEPFDERNTEEALRKTAERLGIAAAKLIHPLRVALTGQAVSAGIFTVLVLVGRDRACSRIDGLLHHLREIKI